MIMKSHTLALRKPSQPREASRDRIFYGVVNAVLALLLVITIYPLIYILSSSFSSPAAVTTGKVVLWPVSFSFRGYEAVFDYNSVFVGYRNTIFYTLLGTAVNVSLTLLAAYPLARSSLPGRKFFTFLFTFTMLFDGGLIPNYLLMRDLHIINTVWVMVIPGAISAYNLIVTRTFIQSNVPSELLEAAEIDGCSDFRFFFSILLPLSKAVVAVITLYYAVVHWNAYFKALIYLHDAKLYPLQIYLREILVMNSVDTEMISDPSLQEEMQGMADLLKYSLIVVSSAPIMMIYPFLQRYFIQGVMIGSLKG